MALYAFDGTWNEDEVEEANDTNIVRFSDAYQGNVFYLEGVGTRMGFFGKILGGLTGAGGHIRIDEALDCLGKNFEEGDQEIDIIGFSRGSALAVHFANMIFKEKHGAPIRFIGLFDVVASFGLPGNDLNIGWKLTLPPNVKKCFHAMALDERCGNFPVTRIRPEKGTSAGAGRLREVWFRGVHSDVGGSASMGLSGIALSWMFSRAERANLPIDVAKVQRVQALCNPDAPISRNFDLLPDPPRKVRTRDWVHASVKPRGKQGGITHNDPPAGCRITDDQAD
ncbi:MAG: DUF2235 domain-containing protein [Syntrophaceae bacterium]|nr:DUF2235 domain-containing protein [Syntrophaceae bacterium]